MESPLPVNVVVAKWEPGVKYTGWLGEGSVLIYLVAQPLFELCKDLGIG